MDNNIKLLWQEVYDIQSQPVVDAPSQFRLNQICSQLRGQTLSEDQAERSLLLGYIAYHFQGLVQASLDCEQELQTALRLSPGNPTAILYLGHLCFDQADYARAKMHLRSLDLSKYSSASQGWRVLKIRELLVACDFKLGLFRDAWKEANGLLADMDSAGTEDCPIPIELVTTIMGDRQRLEAALGKSDVKALIDKIVSLGEQQQWPPEMLGKLRG